jgi:hypothetical protein
MSKFFKAFNPDILQWEVRKAPDMVTIKPCRSEDEATKVVAYLNQNLKQSGK